MKKVIKFSASRCWPCRMIAPIIDALAEQFPDVEYVKVDVDVEENKELSKEYSVRSIPHVVFIWEETTNVVWAKQPSEYKALFENL